jgi:hypothetical protein
VQLPQVGQPENVMQAADAVHPDTGVRHHRRLPEVEGDALDAHGEKLPPVASQAHALSGDRT